MKTITVITPANIEVEYRLAGVGSRLAAFIIDYLIQMLVLLLAGCIILLGFDRWFLGNVYPSGTALGAVLIVFFAVHFGYFILFESVMHGRSPGKKLFGLRAIRENGEPLQLSNIVIRCLFRSSVDMLYVGLFTIMFSERHKRLGDMAAGTVVISEHYTRSDPSSLF
ncbi:MAG: RDD family protein [Defluviitaleaceae bacterium]|nr:RDD family protein [Defluviitaleaceae bacterium]